MSVFLWSPKGDYCKLQDLNKCKHLVTDQDLSKGTWYYGPIEDLPTQALENNGWLVDFHNVWDHPETRTIITKAIKPMCIISYLSYNGKLAREALNITQQSGTPIIIVYEHSHKAAVMIQLRLQDCEPIGLIDDRWVNLQPVIAAQFLGIHCLTAVDPDICICEITCVLYSKVTVVRTISELYNALKK